jgi:hypothetical protein
MSMPPMRSAAVSTARLVVGVTPGHTGPLGNWHWSSDSDSISMP